MSMNTARDLFEHELLDMYDAEHRLVKSLPKMAEEASDDGLRAGFERHAEETRGHIERLERCCELLGIDAKQLRIADMAVNPISGTTYLSVSRGRGADAG